MKKLLTMAAALALAAVGALVAPSAASAATLFPCEPSNAVGLTGVCTRITSAPGGVQVYDRQWGRTHTLHNGDSVHLKHWMEDTSGLCGVHGDKYVWAIYWTDGRAHHAVIGDWYLATGAVSYWPYYPDSHGRTLNDNYGGVGAGNCDVFPTY